MTLHELGLLVQVVIWTCVCMVPLFLIWLTVAGCCVIARRRLRVRTPAQPSRVICPCCTTRPMESDDCTCRDDCGVTWCQAADPDGPMFIEGHHVIDRAGREAILRRAREEDEADADEFDAIVAEWDRQKGNAGD